MEECMEYNVEDLAKIAGVSVRTLHYYDEIGLVTPAYRVTNGRRYGIEQLLTLMDVLFLKRMGFSLKKIKYLLSISESERNSAIETKKQFLQKEIKRIEELIKSVDQMKEFRFEVKNISPNEIRKRFEANQNEANEYKLLFKKEFGSSFDDEVKKAPQLSIEEQKELVEEKFRNMDKALYAKKTALVMKKTIDAIHSNRKENSQEAQQLIKEYFEVLAMFNPALSKKDMLSTAISMIGDMDTYTMFFKLHPKLSEFLSRAMVIYIRNLKE
jgi:MerR family transcriptional regulator, thiopeptide resistance regulator